MGYESKIYIVEKGVKLPTDSKKYARVIAMFDLCNCNFIYDFFRECDKTDCYFYADDGNTQVLKDCYDDPLKETTLENLIEVIENAISNGENYRRIFPLLACLKTIHSQQSEKIWTNVVALHYGN